MAKYLETIWFVCIHHPGAWAVPLALYLARSGGVNLWLVIPAAIILSNALLWYPRTHGLSLTPIRYLWAGPSIISAAMHHSAPGKSTTLSTLAGRKFLIGSAAVAAEVMAAPDDVLSFLAFSRQLLQTDHQLPGWFRTARFSPLEAATYGAVKAHLITQLPARVPELVSSVAAALADTPMNGDALSAMPLLFGAAARCLSTSIVGARLAAEPAYAEALVAHHTALALGGYWLAVVPAVLRPWAARFSGVWRPRKVLAATVAEEVARRRQHAGSGSGSGCNDDDDILQRLLDDPQGWSVAQIADSLLLIHFTAAHATAYVLVQTMLELAARPDHQTALRSEVRERLGGCGDELGWTLSGVESLTAVDAFMKESQRVNEMSYLHLNRIALKTHTFSDGSTVLPGTHVAVPAPYPPAPFDPSRYSDAGVRFADVGYGVNKLSFGSGKHVCIGRFYAAALIKIVLAMVLTRFEVSLPEGGQGKEAKRNWSFMEYCVVDPKVELVFTPLEKRAASASGDR